MNSYVSRSQVAAFIIITGEHAKNMMLGPIPGVGYVL
jgi:hypothetical protein